MLTMTIPQRFRGPPNSGNGGYVCGTWELRDSDVTVAVGRPVSLDLTRVEKASFDEAAKAERNPVVKPHEHLLPMCFVCGPQRAPGDGLRIGAGPLAELARGRRSALCLLLRQEHRRLRPNADLAGSNVGTNRGASAPWRALRHHRLGDQPRRPQAHCRGRSPW